MRQESDDKEIPQELKKLEGRNYVFEIRLNECNSHDGLQNYTATKVYESKEEIKGKKKVQCQTNSAYISGKQN